MFRIPWTAETMPHLVLDVSRECNICCRGCYRHHGKGYPSLETILGDLEAATNKSRLHTVSFAGAEPTLNPDLPKIISTLHGRRLRTALATNGVLLDRRRLAELRAAGLDFVMFHVDEGQRRPDLPPDPSLETVNALRAELAARAAAEGIDAGFSATIYPEYADRLPGLIDFILRSEHAHFLLASPYTEVRAIAQGVYRSEDGTASARADPVEPWAGGRMTNRDFARIVQEQLGLTPMAYLPSRLGLDGDASFPSWLAYCVAVVAGSKGFQALSMHGGWPERLLLSLRQQVTGRFPYYVPQRPAVTAGEVLLNTLLRGRVWRGLSFLGPAIRGKSRLWAKRFVFDNAPMLTPDGQVTCTEPCPHPTVKDGALVPACMAAFPVNEPGAALCGPEKI